MERLTLLMPSKIQKKQSAFSLIELLITVTIMTLVLSLAMVNYLRNLEKQRLYEQAERVMVMIQDSRVKAASGYLGNASAGYCAELIGVRFSAGLSSGQYRVNQELHCASGSVLPLNQFVLDPEFSFNLSPVIEYFPLGALSLKANGVATDTLNFSFLSSKASDYQVDFEFDRGGALTINYL